MKKLIVVCFILTLTTFTKPAHSAMGDLDTSFGNSGIFTSSLVDSTPRSLAIDSTGEIYIAGNGGTSTTSTAILVHISSNGLSENVLVNGTTPPLDLVNSAFYSVLVKNGKIFAGGENGIGSLPTQSIIAGFNPDGSLDSTFGDGDGIAQEVSSGSPINSYGRAMALDSAGNFILAGGTHLSPASAHTQFQVLRFSPTGSLDTSFGGGNGYVVEDFTSNTDNDMANAVAIDTAGRIVVAGTTGNKIGIVRYTAEGVIDTTFSAGDADGDGRIISSLSTGTEVANSVAITSTGKIIVAGYIYEDNVALPQPTKSLVLLQYNPDGSLDNTFGGGDGVVTTSIGAQRTVANAMVLDNNERIVVAGHYYENSGSSIDTVLLRYNTDGSLDNTFSNDGQVFSNLDTVNHSDQNYSLAIDSQNNILVGSLNNTTTHVSRYIGRPVCGNSLIEENESCDIGDTLDHDGCSSTCLEETAYFIDADGDGFGSETKYYSMTHPGAGYSTTNDDCDDTNALASPAGTEVCDGADNNCNGTIDDNPIDSITYYTDADGDGYGAGTTTTGCSLPAGSTIAGGDCDDGNANINPGKAEICENSINENCSDIDDDKTGANYYADADGDGYGAGSALGSGCTVPAGSAGTKNDCDDTKASVHEYANEICDGLDNDCDGLTDELSSCTDADSDGVFADTDCNDNNASLGAQQNYYPDADGDTFGENSSPVLLCAPLAGYVTSNTDCNDNNVAINTSASEVCSDSEDNNCNGTVNEDCTASDTTSGGTTGSSSTGGSTTGSSTNGSSETTGSKNESAGSGSGSSGGCQLVTTAPTNHQAALLIFAMALLAIARARRLDGTQ